VRTWTSEGENSGAAAPLQKLQPNLNRLRAPGVNIVTRFAKLLIPSKVAVPPQVGAILDFPGGVSHVDRQPLYFSS
jgi:hypothetical protein